MICALRSQLGHILAAAKFWATTYEQGESTMKVKEILYGENNMKMLSFTRTFPRKFLGTISPKFWSARKVRFSFIT
jgi:hypothetical protein